ncbi:Transcriptional regulator, AraC family [Halomonas citrativorans]|uniref:Helix-turn-helix transcriptional regulator n=1 Tax=Halomonas citrativorans TaxID=2742612 RepID=A0A1R4HPV8_9GAMM|nr:AraC family transcriptional regulator [Halomonas citrativorans]MBE0402260.1 helix-turn-helix transcriptional regulator [Halomonas citrativorans]SJN09560.1 Transcriptional regulator, AraC family [Halomonas citrativorans]
MNGSVSTGYSLDNTAFSGSDRLKQAKQLLTLLMETERALHHNSDIASTYLNEAIALLAIDSQGGPSPHRNRGGLARWQISRIDEFINEHLDQCIRTTELALLLGLSVSHFSHVFKQTTGMTPLMYVTTKRVEAARQYMLCSIHSLSDIALSHGFCDQSHFCRVFRRETGLSPQTWRKLHTENPPADYLDPSLGSAKALAEQPAGHEANYPRHD